MITRRSVLTGATMGGLLGSLAPHNDVEAAEPQNVATMSPESVAAIQTVARAVTTLKDEVRRQTTFFELDAVRVPIQLFLRNTGKFPDFIEVGIDIWQQIYDWHVRMQQPFTIARSTEGRYTIVLMATLCIMRTELPPSYIGAPYDNR